MILSCPSCGSRYLVNPLHLGEQGRRVKCANCNHVWFQERPPETLPPLEPEPYDGPHGGDHGAARGGRDAGGAGRPGPAGAAIPPSPHPSTHQSPSAGYRYQVPSTEVRHRRSGPMAAWLLLLLLVGGVFAVGAAAREEVVRYYPPAIQVYDLIGLDVDRGIAIRSAGVEPGLAFEDVAARLSSTVDGQAVVLSGVLVNASAETRAVRPISASLLDGDGTVVERWEIGTGRASLAPGERVEFSTRRSAWPEGVESVRLGLVPPPAR